MSDLSASSFNYSTSSVEAERERVKKALYDGHIRFMAAFKSAIDEQLMTYDSFKYREHGTIVDNVLDSLINKSKDYAYSLLWRGWFSYEDRDRIACWLDDMYESVKDNQEELHKLFQWFMEKGKQDEILGNMALSDISEFSEVFNPSLFRNMTINYAFCVHIDGCPGHVDGGRCEPEYVYC